MTNDIVTRRASAVNICGISVSVVISTPVGAGADLVPVDDMGDILGRYADCKRQTMSLSALYRGLDDNKGARLADCSTFLRFWVRGKAKKLIGINSCRVRLCPSCAWRRSLKAYAEARQVHDYLGVKYQDSKYLFMTLTARNVPPEGLTDAVSKLLGAWGRFCKYKSISAVMLGYMRALEVTYNPISGTYHPHIHVLIHTQEAIYTHERYITQRALSAVWRRALGVDYTPVVDIRLFKARRGATIGKALAEVCKYAVKPMDAIRGGQAVVWALDAALSGRRLLGYGGTWRAARAALKLEDDITDNSPVPPGDDGYEVIYRWHFGRRQYIRDDSSGGV